MKTKIVIAVVCVDWRMHHPKSNFMEKLYEYTEAEKIYVVTYPGPNGTHNDSEKRDALEKVIEKTRNVIAEHGATNISKYLVAHEECAGHTVENSVHLTDGNKTVEKLNKELGFNVGFKLLFAKKGENDFDWSVETA